MKLKILFLFFISLFLTMTAVSAAEYSDYYINGGEIVTNDTGLQYQITKSDNTTSVKWNKSITTDGAIGIQKYTVLVQSDEPYNYTLSAINKFTGEERWNMSLDTSYKRLQFIGGKYAVLLSPDKFIQVNLYSHKIVTGKTFDSAANQYYGLIKSKKNGNYYIMTVTDGEFRFFKALIEESSDIFACDLKISRYTQDTGSITVRNSGNKNSPADGFDVLLYYKRFDSSVYASVYHATGVIAPGYSQSFIGAFSTSDSIMYGLIRVNPYKKFQEQDYNNNVRTFSLVEAETASYTATEQSRYYGGDYWEYYDGYTWASGNSTTCANSGYSPLISTNPITDGYNYYLGYWSRQHHWEWRDDPLYVNAVQINSASGGKEYKNNYVTVSGVAYDSNMHIYVDVGFAKQLTYNTEKGIWEAYIKYGSAKAKDGVLIKIYSDRTGQDGTDDIMNFVSNVEVHTYYIKNSWTWLY